MHPQLFCKADFMVSLENGSVSSAQFGKGVVWQQPFPSGDGLWLLVCQRDSSSGGEEMGVKGGRAGVRCGPRTGSQTRTVRLGLSFPTCERGQGRTRLARGTVQGCGIFSPQHEVLLPWEETAGLRACSLELEWPPPPLPKHRRLLGSSAGSVPSVPSPC